ncbi:MAG: hypothetical protein WCT29_00960 [Candidatus Paceibacterota bacterium]|jgi:DNA polymerase III delta prime subunit
MLADHLNKDNLHHAYLIEGERESVMSELLEFFENSKINTSGNSDFINIHVDSFKMDDARNLKVHEREKSFSDNKKIFIISANSILLEAQNTLLKLFEEPIPQTHFFVIVPDTNALLRTLVSRFQVISARNYSSIPNFDTDRFLAMTKPQRLEYLKAFLKEPEESEEVVLVGARAQALNFLNSLELTLHNKMPKAHLDSESFEQIFQVRKFLRMPGSSVKNLMESVALTVPMIE